MEDLAVTPRRRRATPCRFCGAPLDARRSSTSACRRSPNSYSRPSDLRARWSRSTRCTRSSARECFLVQLARVRAARGRSSADYAYFSSYSDELARARAPLRRADGRALRPRRRLEPGRRDRAQRRLPAAVLRRARHPGARHRAGREHGRGRAIEKGIPTIVALLRDARPRATLVGEARRADLLIGNNVLAHVPDLNDFVAGLKRRCSQPGGRHHDGVPAPPAADRGDPVRHDLPRALLVLLAR